MKLLGDLLAGITHGLGIRECGGCKRRRAKLNAAHEKLRGGRKRCDECVKARRMGSSS